MQPTQGLCSGCQNRCQLAASRARSTPARCPCLVAPSHLQAAFHCLAYAAHAHARMYTPCCAALQCCPLSATDQPGQPSALPAWQHQPEPDEEEPQQEAPGVHGVRPPANGGCGAALHPAAGRTQKAMRADGQASDQQQSHHIWQTPGRHILKWYGCAARHRHHVCYNN